MEKCADACSNITQFTLKSRPADQCFFGGGREIIVFHISADEVDTNKFKKYDREREDKETFVPEIRPKNKFLSFHTAGIYI